MATGTVKESEEKRKREETLAEARRELREAMAKYARAELACCGAGSRHESLLDRRLRAEALELARQGLELAYGKDDAAPGGCPDCGGRTRLLRVEKPRVETVLGSVSVEMARRTCRECGRSARPRERRLDIEGSMTPSARRLASLAGSQASYAAADELLRELSGLNFGAKRVERATRAVGEDLEAWRTETNAGGGASPREGEVSLREEASKPGRQLCCALDGTGVPARPSETAGRAGKDGADPSGSERAGTREAKVGALWVSEKDPEGRPRMVEGTAVLFAGIESAAETPGEESPFERRLLRELAAAGCEPQDVDVCVGDGAGWIRRIFDDWCVDARKVVDFYHAAEYLWAAARARHGDGDLAGTWAGKLCGMLKAGRLGDVLDDLRRRGGDVEACRKAVAYLDERRDRMRYDEHLAAGLPIGSGIIEAGCKNVVGQRTKCAGMRWTVAGANPVLWLRCARLGRWFDKYWDDRTARLAA